MGLLDYFDKFIVDSAQAPGPKSRSGLDKVDRRLPDRSFLNFQFPRDREGGPPLSIILPFFENVKILEKKRARYQKYQPISRSSELYAYLGANSRQLTLSFALTLKHIESEGPNIETYMNALTEETYTTVKEKFKGKSINPPPSQAALLGGQYLEGAKDSANSVINSWYSFLEPYELGYLEARYGIYAQPDSLAIETAAAVTPGVGGMLWAATLQANQQHFGQESNNMLDRKTKVIDMVIYWVNLIRSSVTNNSMDPTLGPPVIRINHGIMYQDIPCVCMSYSVEADPLAPLDMDTLLPQRINIEMNLEEIRTGNFGQFRKKDEGGTAVSRDNLAGWEAVITHSTMDPGQVGGTLQ
jgi:hypothetical protein